MARLSISLLGPFQVALNGEPVTGFKSNKVRALLAYLAVESAQPCPREKLAGLLWPNLPDRAARANLRTTLYDLQQKIADQHEDPSYLHVGGGAIQFNMASDYWLDTVAFEQAIAAGRANPWEVEPWWQAVELYQGAFLEGFSLSNCLAFEEWDLVKRELLNREMVFALQQLAACFERRGQFDKAEAALRHLLQLEPLDEAAHRGLMRLLDTGGQRTAALAHYGRCQQILAEELGVNPSARTRQLYERIRDGDFSRLVDTEGGGAALLSRRSPSSTTDSLKPTTSFIGFESELAHLNRALEKALAAVTPCMGTAILTNRSGKPCAC